MVTSSGGVIGTTGILLGGPIHMAVRPVIATVVAAIAFGSMALAQGGRPLSPAGSSATQVGGKYDTSVAEPVYRNGKWIEKPYVRTIRCVRKPFCVRGTTDERRVLL